MQLSRVLSVAWRLVAGSLLLATAIWMLRHQWLINHWLLNGHVWRGLLLFFVVATTSALLIRSFCRATLFETTVIFAIIFVLECLLIPAVATDHRHRGARVQYSSTQRP
jgi:hypothetical protein